MQAQEIKKEKWGGRRHPLKFEIMNSRSSRNPEQRMARKSEAARWARESKALKRLPDHRWGSRKVYLGEQVIRPNRSLYLDEDALQDWKDELRLMEECGLIIVRFENRDINLDSALKLIEAGTRPQGPFFKRSYVGDPQPLGGADSTLIRMMQPKLEVDYGEEEPSDEDGVQPVEAPESKQEASVQELDMTGLEFLTPVVKKPKRKPDPVDTESEGPDEPVQEEETFTVKEAAAFLEKSESWIRKRMKRYEQNPEDEKGLAFIVQDGKKFLTQSALTPFLVE